MNPGNFTCPDPWGLKAVCFARTMDARPASQRGIMSQEQRARINDLYTAYRAGRIDFVLNDFDDEAELISYAPVQVFPYLGRQHGNAAIAETMKKVGIEFDILTYQPIFMVVESDSAGTIVMARLDDRFHETGGMEPEVCSWIPRL